MTQAPPSVDRKGILAGVVIVVAALAAYHNSFSGPFVFDGDSAVTGNLTIRHLWPIGPALTPPPGGLPVSGRPLANLSLAINYALGGLDVRGYHAFNLVIHAFAALALFGIVRRALGAISRDYRDANPWMLALAVALIWTVHPLQTESVTYVAQRAELLMGLFYFLTLYCFIRGAGSSRLGPWFFLSFAACLAGMATKEVMISAPLIVLLYDRTFVSGHCREAWIKRRGYYIALGSTWLPLAYLVAATGSRGGTAGFASGLPWWEYALTQLKAITLYLRLSIWPHPLVIDYGPQLGGPPTALAVEGLIIAALVVATAIGLRRRSPLGFLGAWFFLILAPSSSVVPIATEIISEHRMYLPLAAVVTLAVLGLNKMCGKKSIVVFIAVALGLAVVTVRRNADYRTARALWAATVEAVPDNAGAHNNLGKALIEEKEYAAAAREFTEALRLNPDRVGTRNNLGVALYGQGKVEDAIPNFEEALRANPDYADAHSNLGRALSKVGRYPEAIAQFEKALRLDPTGIDARISLGTALLNSGRTAEAFAEYNEALRFRPDRAESHNAVAFALAKTGRTSEAISEYKEALRLKPGFSAAHYDLGNILAHNGRLPEAIAEYEAALRIDPNNAETQTNLGSALLQSRRLPEAGDHFKTALRLNPDAIEAQANLGNVFLEMGKAEEAIACYRAAIRLRPGYATAHYNLGVVLRSQGRADEAQAEFETAARLGIHR